MNEKIIALQITKSKVLLITYHFIFILAFTLIELITYKILSLWNNVKILKKKFLFNKNWLINKQ